MVPLVKNEEGTRMTLDARSGRAWIYFVEGCLKGLEGGTIREVEFATPARGGFAKTKIELCPVCAGYGYGERAGDTRRCRYARSSGQARGWIKKKKSGCPVGAGYRLGVKAWQ
jgi:hypothetical protein